MAEYNNAQIAIAIIFAIIIVIAAIKAVFKLHWYYIAGIFGFIAVILLIGWAMPTKKKEETQ